MVDALRYCTLTSFLYITNFLIRICFRFRKFECREDIHYKTQTGTSCEKCNSKAFRLGIEPASSGLLDQCSTTESELQKLLPTTWARVQYIH